MTHRAFLRYMRRYNARRRAAAVLSGTCNSCNAEPRMEGRTQCADCLEAGRVMARARYAVRS